MGIFPKSQGNFYPIRHLDDWCGQQTFFPLKTPKNRKEWDALVCYSELSDAQLCVDVGERKRKQRLLAKSQVVGRKGMPCFGAPGGLGCR